MSVESLGYYAIPAFVSFEGIDKQVNTGIGKALGRFGDIGKTTGAALSRGIGDGASQGVAQIEALAKSYEKFSDKAADAIGKVRVEQARLDKARAGGKADQIAAAEERLAKARRDSTRASKESAAAHDSLQSAQRSLETSTGGLIGKLKNLGGAAGSAGTEAATGFVEGFGGPIARLGTKGGPIGLALAGVAALGITAGTLLAQNIMEAIEREPAKDLIQARLGIDEASMAKLGKAASKSYADNWGESLNDNLEAAQRALQGGLVAGVDDPALTSRIEQLQAMTQLIGGDLTETTKSVSVLMRSGMAASAEDAFDIIAKGFQITGDLGGDWLDSIGEYSSGWKNAGLSATQALALIKQGQDNGVDVTDRSADALREFGRRISEEGDKIKNVLTNIGLDGDALFDAFKKGGPEGFAAFDAVFDRIRSIEDPVKRNQAAMALLGDTAGDFIGSFTKWDPSDAVAKLGSVTGAAQQAANTMGDNTAGKFTEARRSIEMSLEAVQDKLKEGVTPALNDFATWVKTHQPEITGAFVKIGEFAIDMAQDIVSTAGDVAIAMADFIAPIGDVLGALTKVDAWQREHIDRDKAAADQLRAEAEGYFSWGESLKGAGEKMKEFATKGDGLKRSLRDVADGMKDSSKETGIFGKAGDTATDKMKALGEQVDTAAGKVNDLRDAMSKPLIGPGLNLNLPGMSVDPSAPMIGPGLNGPSAPIAAPSSLGSKDDIAKYILASATKLGYSPDQQVALLSTALQESGLDPNAKGGGGAWHGIYQQDTSYPGRDNPQTNIDEFFKRLQGKGGPNGDIWKNIFWLQQRPGDASASAAYAEGRQAYLDEIKSQLGPAKDLYRRLTGMPPAASAAPAPAPVTSPQAYSGARNVTGLGEGKTTPGIEQLAALVAQQFPGINLGGWRPSDGPNTPTGHQRGVALDIGIQDQAMGDRINEWVRANASALGVKSTIWRDKWADFQGNTSTVGGHQDHVHVEVDGQPIAQGISSAMANLGTTSASGQGLTSAGSADLINAFGNGYKPGIGTPGYDEEGNPGYYRVDPRDLSQAQRRIEDTQQAIDDADQRILDAKKARADLEEKLEASAEEKAKADRDITAAERAASRARQDAAFAQEDAAKTAQGKFTAAKKSEKSKNGDSEFGELGAIGSAFLKDMFGLGDIFPDPSQLGIVKMAQAVLGLKYTPQGTGGQGAGQQKQSLLGMLTPGGAAEADAGGGAGGLLDIIPGVSSLFQPPTDAPAAMPGSPPPAGGPQMVDQSTHLTIQNPQGDPAKMDAKLRNTLLNTPRLGTYSAPATGTGG
ncbi:phage tail tape measure protein [Mycolicibacterium llatzerense]|uniref:phage tail tape measure protein n=1 Tax=Mycolicibacterium llatzerense TaxID=280871 RepID=UPI0021B65779|nr:phage tail tape measure protein [Mycolicibacterium llatzerense]MCT7372686.1 hypothetical protein [Mycolicibacterium llatzerense]